MMCRYGVCVIYVLYTVILNICIICMYNILQMLLWWDGLTMIEKRIPSNKDTLIRTAELAFLSQATALGGSASVKDSASGAGSGNNNNNNADDKE